MNLRGLLADSIWERF